MQTSSAGLMALVGREAIVQTRYRDSVGVWTIGVGHTAAAGSPDPKIFTGLLTVEDVIALFRKDVAKYEREVSAAVKVPLAQHEFDALVSFHYNTGRIRSASLTVSLNAGNHALAGAQLMNYVKPKAVADRRETEHDQFLHGTYPPPFATIYPATPSGNILWGKGKRIDLRPYFADASTAPAEPASTRKPVLRRGDKGDAVRALQAALGVTVDGDFGTSTETALKRFQHDRNLTPDGVAGPKTWAALAD